MPAAGGQDLWLGARSSKETGARPTGRPNTCSATTVRSYRNLLQYIIETGVTELENVQYLHVGGKFPDTIVGIGAGMALSKLNSKKPILIMCEVPEDKNLTKISMRTTERIIEKGHRPPEGDQRCLG